MHKLKIYLITLALVLSSHTIAYSQEKLSIAILNLQAGVSRSQSQVDGLADILTVELHKSGAFIIKERLQVDKILSELNLMSTTALDDSQIKNLGERLKVQAILIGTINFLVHEKSMEDLQTGMAKGEYNVDIRLVDVQTGEILSAVGGNIPGCASDRSVMGKIAQQLVENLSPSLRSTTVKTLYGYLTVFPSDLGTFTSYPGEVINAVNRQCMNGFSDWRLPTREELSVMLANKHESGMLSTLTYATQSCFSGNKEYVVRLVRTNIVEKKEVAVDEPYLSPSVCDFGSVSVLVGKASKQITLWNPSSSSIRVSRVKSVSADVSAFWYEDYIEPGKSSSIHVTVNTNGRAGATLNRTLTVYLTDGRVLTLPVKVHVE